MAVVIGANIPLAGSDEALRRAIDLSRDTGVRLLLAGKRDKNETFSVQNYCEENGLSSAEFLPYYDVCTRFPCLKLECDGWIDRAAKPGDIAIEPLLSKRNRIALFATMFHPFKNEGNSVGMRFWIDHLRAHGYQIHLFYYMYDVADVADELRTRAQKEFSKYIEVPVASLLTGRNQNGLNVHPDDWCGPEVIDAFKELVGDYDYDVCFTNYAFFTAIFDYCAAFTRKILYTHDSFSDRNRKMLAQGYEESGWMSLTDDGERLGCSRADVIIAPQEEEATYFRNLTQNAIPVYSIPPIPAAKTIPFQESDPLLVVGYVGSHNWVNELNLTEFLTALAGRSDVASKVRIRIAGGSSEHLGEFCSKAVLAAAPVELVGKVDDLDAFIGECDVIINPEKGGTGIKIKTLDALACGAALVCTRQGAVGIPTDDKFHLAPDIPSLVELLGELTDKRELIPLMRDKSRRLFSAIAHSQESRVDAVLEPQAKQKSATEEVVIAPESYVTTPYIDKYAASYHFAAFKNVLSKTSVSGKTIVEIGTDEHAIMARLFVANGAAKVYSYNVSGWTKREELPDGVEIIAADFVNCDLPASSVDLIFGVAILEHIHSGVFDQLLKKMQHILKPRGRFWLQGEPLWPSRLGHHLYYLSPKSGILYAFSDNNPVADWSHLLLSRKEMAATLVASGIDAGEAEGMAESIYADHQFCSNHLAASQIVDYFDKYAYFIQDRSISAEMQDSNHDAALLHYSEDDLRCSGITLFGRMQQVCEPDASVENRISVIIPCYNVEEFVEECVRSVLKQTYRNIEVVLIDDASTDGTLDILTRLAIEDERVILHRHTINLGLGPARNSGVERATGQYLFFLDSDDYLSSEVVLESLVEEIRRENTPVVVSMCRKLTVKGTVEDFDHSHDAAPNVLYDGRDAAMGAFWIPGHKIVPVRAWGSLIDMGFYKGLNLNPFPPGAHEDLAFVPFMYALADKVFYSSIISVIYRERPTSLSNRLWDTGYCVNHSLLWAAVRANAVMAGLEEWIPVYAFRIMDNALHKIYANCFEKSPKASEALLNCLHYISGDIQRRRVEQNMFDYVFSMVRALKEHDPKQDKYKEILGSFNSENVVNYFFKNNARVKHSIKPLPTRKIQDKNDAVVAEILESYRNQASEEVKTYPAMLTEGDRALYYTVAAKAQCVGQIVDVGCFVGGTTCALAEGLLGNSRYKPSDENRIRVFDTFEIDAEYLFDWLKQVYGDAVEPNATSFRCFFDSNMFKWKHLLDVREGNIVEIGYPQKQPIEILGLDKCQDIAVLDSVLRNFFPYLIPGISVVVHQDYIHEWHPYIHLSMALLKDYFEPIVEINGGGSYMWKCIKRVSQFDVVRIFGADPVTDLSAPSWFTDVIRNMTLLKKEQTRLRYANNQQILGYVRAIYHDYLGQKDVAERVAWETHAQYRHYPTSDGIKKRFGFID